MSISVLDLFKIGVGPSSSHTVGPMRAAHEFVVALQQRTPLEAVRRIEVKLYGSLSATGVGHATDRAVIAGLMGARHAPAAGEPALPPHRDAPDCAR